MSKFKVGEEVIIYSSPAAEHFHGKAATVFKIEKGGIKGYVYRVIIKGDLGANLDGTRVWIEEAFRKLIKLERAMK